MISCTFEDGNQASLRHAVVDVLVLNESGQLLMVKRTASLIEGGKWGIVGGFAERDERLADSATREIYEETGWEIKDLTLLTINDDPARPKDLNRQNISVVYFCQATKKTGEPDWESDEQRWYDLDDLPARQQIAFDHADYIDLYKRYQREKFALPLID